MTAAAEDYHLVALRDEMASQDLADVPVPPGMTIFMPTSYHVRGNRSRGGA